MSVPCRRPWCLFICGAAAALLAACAPEARPAWVIEHDPGTGPRRIDGRAVYERFCQVCHQPAGEGNEFYPALTGSAIVSGPDRSLVLMLLHGIAPSADSPYLGAMVPFGTQLDDGQVAAVLTYVRWLRGPGLNAIEPGAVARWRGQTRGRLDPYARAELPGLAAEPVSGD